MPASIGELNERSLHRALKQRYAARGGTVETVVGGYVADVLLGDRIVEIQTGSFSSLRRKLPRLLAEYPVTLVHPIARDRFIVRMNDAAPDGAEPAALARRRKSPKHGSPFDVFHALTGIPTLLDHPNLTLDIVMVIDEDIRLARGSPSGSPAEGSLPYEGRRRRRRDWLSVDRRLLEVIETHTIEGMADLFAMVDDNLPDEFTSRDLARAMHSSPRLGQRAAFCFREAALSEICGKRNRFLLYRRAGDLAAREPGAGRKSRPIE